MSEEIQNPVPFFLSFERGKEWIFKNRLLLLLILSAFCLSTVLLYRTLKKPDYSKIAEKEYANFLATGDDASFVRLLSLVNGDQSLQCVYDGAIARVLLEKKEMDKGLFFLVRALKPFQEISPYHAHYAASTVTIAKGEWEQALQETELLKQKFLEDKSLQEKMSALYSSILLRSALLEKKLGASKQELKAWEAFESLSSKSKMIEAFHQKGLALEDFIQNRKKTLYPYQFNRTQEN